MSTSSFNMYLKQNKNEFNEEYERCMRNNVKKSQIVQNSTRNRIEKKKVIEDNLPEMCNKNKLLTAKQIPSKINQNVLLPKETVYNKLLGQTSHTDSLPASLPASSTNLTSSVVRNTQILMSCNMSIFFNGFCFSTLMHSICKSQFSCTFNHDVGIFIKFFINCAFPTCFNIILFLVSEFY